MYLGALETAGDAQFPPGRFPGEPGSDNVPVEELEKGLSHRLLWVAADTVPIAFLLAREEGEHLHLRQVVVHPDRQRQGIGRALVEHLENAGRERGAARVTLTTFEDISWNAPLYERLGFRILDDLSGSDMEYLVRELADQAAAGMVRRVAMSKSLENKRAKLEI